MTTNSAGGTKELYYSNGGMIDMDKQTVTPTGGIVDTLTADADGWLTLTVPAARAQITLSVETPTLDLEHPAKPDPREVEVHVVPD